MWILKNTESKTNHHQWQTTGSGGRTEMAVSNSQIRQQVFYLFLFYFNLPNQWIRDPKRWKCTVEVVPHKSQPIPLVARSWGMFWQGICYELCSYKVHSSCRCLARNDLFVQRLKLTKTHKDGFNMQCHLLVIRNCRNKKVGLEEVNAPGKIEFTPAWGLWHWGKSGFF